MKTIRLGIFISGRGSNARNIYHYFKNHHQIEVSKIVSNYFETPLKDEDEIGQLVECRKPSIMTSDSSFIEYCKNSFDYIILAGYLKLIPQELIAAFPQKIFNIHPALLPKYGGKGMYGMNVHTSVFENKEKTSGITIHLIDSEYDKGQYLAQFFTSIEHCQSSEEIAKTVLKLEHAYYATVIEKTILNKEGIC